MTYTNQLLLIENAFLEERDDEAKQSLLAAINCNLTTEIGLVNVSLGKGLAQRAPRSFAAASDVSEYRA